MTIITAVQPDQHSWHLASHPWSLANATEFIWMEKKGWESTQWTCLLATWTAGFTQESRLLRIQKRFLSCTTASDKANSFWFIKWHTPSPPELPGTAILSYNTTPLTCCDNVQRNHVQGIGRIPDKWERWVQMYIANDENWLRISSSCCWFNVG